MRFITFFAVLIFSYAVSAQNDLEPKEGHIDVEGGRVWFKIVGSGDNTPLLLLHGGPGAPSYYLNPLEKISIDRPVIFYDQLGAGRSDRPNDSALWTVERFVKELAQVRQTLGLDEVHILGHSWGTMLLMEYMMTNPEGVKSLILASPAISVRRWTEDAKRLLAAMPESVQEIIEKHEAAGTFDSPEYQEATMAYYRKYLSVSDPWAADLEAAFENFNPDLYGYMWGPSEFSATGTLKNFERENVLTDIEIPVLFTAGRYDEATPETLAVFKEMTPNSQMVIFENSAHMTMLDEPVAYIEAIRKFLNEIERD